MGCCPPGTNGTSIKIVNFSLYNATDYPVLVSFDSNHKDIYGSDSEMKPSMLLPTKS